MLKSILSICLFISLTSAWAQKAFDEYAVDKNFVPFATSSNKALPGTTAEATVTVKASNEMHKIRRSLFGQNSVGYQGNLDKNSREAINWKSGNFSILRYPGGNWSNKWFWDGQVPTSIKTSTTIDMAGLLDGQSPWMLGTDEFPDFLDFTGADGMVCVNAGYAFYGDADDPVATAAQYAADWVEYYNVTLGAGIKYWEIGNENYGPWTAGFDLGTPEEYGQICVTFAEKMKAIDPTIEIGVVLYEGYGGFNNTVQGKDWNEKVMPITQDIADFYIIHHYPHPNNNQNDISEADIYKARSVVHETYEMMNDLTETYTKYEAGHFPVAITEFNARAGVRNLSRTNALFTTLMLGEYAKYDFACAAQWDLVNAYNPGEGDHGLVSRRDPFLDRGSVNPEFYAFYYLDKYFGDMMVNSSSDDSDIITYATTFSSGELGLVIVNKGSSDKVVDIDVKGFTNTGNIYWHTLEGDESDFDRTVYINGVGPDTTFIEGQTYTSNYGNNENSQVASAFETNGVSGPQNYQDVMPFSALVPNGPVKFEAPRYSVSFIAIEGNATGCLFPDIGEDQVLCESNKAILDGTVSSSDAVYTWKKDGKAISNLAVLEVIAAGIYSVEVKIPNCALATDEITITSSLLDVTHDTVCNPGETASLQINETGSFAWYDSETGGNELSTALIYEPVVTADTYYYVEDQRMKAYTVGKIDQDGGVWANTAPGVYAQSDRKTIVTVEQKLILVSFDVFVNTDQTDMVLNITGNGLNWTNTYNDLPSGRQTILINAELETGTYTIDLDGTVGGIFFQHENSDSKEIPGLISFTQEANWASAYYGMFYDWQLEAKSSSCARTAVAALIDAKNPDCIILSSDVFTSLETPIMYPNPTKGIIHFPKTTIYKVLDLSGLELLSGKEAQADLSELNTGFYIVETEDGRAKVLKR